MVNTQTSAIIGRAPIVRADFTGGMETIVANIQAGYSALGGGNRDTIGDKIAEVRVIAGEEIVANYKVDSIDDKVVLTIPDKGSVQVITNFFTSVVIPAL